MQWFKDLLDYFIGDEVACEELKKKKKTGSTLVVEEGHRGKRERVGSEIKNNAAGGRK